MLRRLIGAAGLAACLGLSACVTGEQDMVTACEAGNGGVRLVSTMCDNEQRFCGDRPDAHQHIWVHNGSSSAAAVTLQFSDGTEERRVMPGGADYIADKALGVGVKVLSQC